MLKVLSQAPPPPPLPPSQDLHWANKAQQYLPKHSAVSRTVMRHQLKQLQQPWSNWTLQLVSVVASVRPHSKCQQSRSTGLPLAQGSSSRITRLSEEKWMRKHRQITSAHCCRLPIRQCLLEKGRCAMAQRAGDVSKPPSRYPSGCNLSSLLHLLVNKSMQRWTGMQEYFVIFVISKGSQSDMLCRHGGAERYSAVANLLIKTKSSSLPDCWSTFPGLPRHTVSQLLVPEHAYTEDLMSQKVKKRSKHMTLLNHYCVSIDTFESLHGTIRMFNASEHQMTCRFVAFPLTVHWPGARGHCFCSWSCTALHFLQLLRHVADVSPAVDCTSGGTCDMNQFC